MRSLYAADDDEVHDFAGIEAICSGALEDFARTLAGRAAAAQAAEPAGDATMGARDSTDARLATIEAGFARAREQGLAEEALGREVLARQLEWLRLEVRSIEVQDEDVAREAAMCVRHDGWSIEDAARAARSHAEPQALLAEELDHELTARLVPAEPGSVVGPVRRDGSFLVMELLEKEPPTLDDPDVRQRAERRVVDRLMRRAVGQHVRWHEHL